LGHWYDAQSLMTSDKMREPTPLWRHPQENQNHNFSNKKNINYKTSPIFRGFGQLSYSIGRRVMGVQSSANKWCTWH